MALKYWNWIFYTLIFLASSQLHVAGAMQLQAAQKLKEQKAKQMERETKKIGAKLAQVGSMHLNPPQLPFRVVNTETAVTPDLAWSQSSAITGVVNKNTGSLAIARTYARHDTLEGTLTANGLTILWETLKLFDKGASGNDHKEDEKAKPLPWQVLYMVRKEITPSSTKWFVEGVGFIQGPWVKNPDKMVEIPYIATGLSQNARSCIGHLETDKIKFVEVEVSKEQLEVVRHIASLYYPRFLCMSDINVCFAGHSGLCQAAWNTSLNAASGYPPLSHLFYGFTLIKNKGAPGFTLHKNTGSLTMFDPKNQSCVNAEEKLKGLGLAITDIAIK